MKNLIITIFALAVSLAASAQTSSNGYYKGDINNDSKVDILDVAALVKVLNGGAEANAACKVNNDDKVNLGDLNALVEIVLGKKDKVWVETAVIIEAGDLDNPDERPKPGQDGTIPTDTKKR